MNETPLKITDFSIPQVLIDEKDYIVVYKPPRMHSAPLLNSTEKTLLKWSCEKYPEIAVLPGRRQGEGGLLHRLDYETQGLILLARTAAGMKALLNQQREGKLRKEYCALVKKNSASLPGFPSERPELPDNFCSGGCRAQDTPVFQIRSAFRAFGKGRKAVRPVLVDTLSGGLNERNTKKSRTIAQGGVHEEYITDILEANSKTEDTFSLCLRIVRGFRHQIRSHLAWLGLPIINDGLYGGVSLGKGFLGLRAVSLLFDDPRSGKARVFAIPQLDIPDI